MTSSTADTSNITAGADRSVADPLDSVVGVPAQGTASSSTRQTKRYLEPGNRPHVPKMPKIGLPEKVYLNAAREAEARGDDLTFEAAKVGQYVSLALRDLDARWEKKLKYFRHALKRHCQPPEHADAVTKAWFEKLAAHVKSYAGNEALRLAAEQDECFETRRELGQTADEIAEDAEPFFDMVCPHCDTCPPVYNESEWEQLKEYRDRWI